MLSPLITSSKKGFSILVALGTTGVLLIITLGIASVYLTELQLSRLHYDNVLTYAQAEWAFEYAMLKVANHREGFQDAMTKSDLDGAMLVWSTERTKNTETSYTIEAQSNRKIFSLGWGKHLILPLFVGNGDILSNNSKNPSFNSGITQISQLQLQTTSSDISWSIVAMSGSENISIAGTGEINNATIGTMRLRGISCYDTSGAEKPINIWLNPDWSCPSWYNAEDITYFYDMTGSVDSFLTSDTSPFWSNPQTSRKMDLKDPYLMVFNNSSSSVDLTISASTPFALPDITVTAESRKWNAMQSIRFYRDNSPYYDALKYGIYDTSPPP